jgi:hypothetical protein
VEEVISGVIPSPISDERPAKRRRGRPKGTTNKARMYDRAVIALMTAPTIEKAAEMLGVSRQSIHNWLRDPEFLDKLNETREVALGHAVILLSAAAGTAIHTLIELSTDKGQPGSVRTSAATALANLIQKNISDERQVKEQASRIESLRRALDEAKRSNGLDEHEYAALPSSTEG